MSAAPDGNFVVVWHGFGPDGNWNVTGQRYGSGAMQVPSLPPGAAAAAALLMLVAVAFALRRRG